MGLSDFDEIRLRMPPTTLFPDGVLHSLFVRAHVGKNASEEEIAERTLFLVNIPVDCSRTQLRTLFSRLGDGARLEHVRFHGARRSEADASLDDIAAMQLTELDGVEDESMSKEIRRLKNLSNLPSPWPANGGFNIDLHPSGATAHITLLEPQERTRILRTLKARKHKPLEIDWESLTPTPAKRSVGTSTDNADDAGDDAVPLYGRARYEMFLRRSRYPDRGALQRACDATLELYDAEVGLRRKRQKMMRTEADADGFVTVTRGGRAGVGKVAEAKAQAQKAAAAQRGIAADLYRFRRQHDRAQKQSDLRAKFELDKKKIDQLKQQRKFKPL
ncbi:hypothetical protein PYCC9005_004078 [Savitreella phatthalungensis]